MTPKTVVENLDVFKDIQSGLGPGGILPMKNQLSFEGAKETFDRGIVITVTFAAHTSHHPSSCQQSLVLIAGVLAAPIGVVQQARGRLAHANGHLQGVDDQLAVQAVTHRPADDTSGIDVQNHSQIEPPFRCWHISDVSQPNFIAPCRFEILLKPIGGDRQFMYPLPTSSLKKCIDIVTKKERPVEIGLSEAKTASNKRVFKSALEGRQRHF